MNSWLPLVITVLATLAGVVVGALLNASSAKKLAERTALLARGTNLHPVQVEHLCKLCSFLLAATEYGQKLTAGSTWSDDPSEQKTGESFVKSLSSAYGEYSDCRLLLPREVAKQVESFFRKMMEYRIELGVLPLTPAGHQHAEAFKAAQRTANQDIPKLLQAIEDSSRRIIGSDSEPAAPD